MDLGYHSELSDGTHKVHHVELTLQLLVSLFVQLVQTGFIGRLMSIKASQAHAVKKIVKHLFVAVVKASSQDDVFEDFLQVALIYLRLGVDLFDHNRLVDILLYWLNILNLIQLP